MHNVNAADVIARYQQALADATHRAILAEATLAATLAEMQVLRAAQATTETVTPEEEA